MARTLRRTTTVDQETGEDIQEPRRRGRPTKHPLPMGSNVTDATIEEFGNKALTAKRELEEVEAKAKSLRGAYRAILKEAKNAGVDPDAVTWWLGKRKQEIEDVNREIAWQNRIAKVMGLPIGIQLGIDFETGETIATAIDKRQLAERRRAKRAAKTNGAGTDPRVAYVMGYDAGKAGKSPNRAGRHLVGAAAVEFQKGWEQGQKDAAQALGPQGDQAPSAAAAQ